MVRDDVRHGRREVSTAVKTTTGMSSGATCDDETRPRKIVRGKEKKGKKLKIQKNVCEA